MCMSKDGINLNTQRVTFTKKVKREVLLDVVRGLTPEEALLKHAFSNKDEILAQDKKYASKLVHKWRKEVYDNREFLNLLHYDVDDQTLEKHIEDFGDNDDLEHFELNDALDDLNERFVVKFLEK